MFDPAERAIGWSFLFSLRQSRPTGVPLWKNEQTPAGNKIVAGVEFNSIGRRVAYHVLKEHPEESGLFGSFGGETVRVPADRVRHLYNPLRPSAARGEPWFSSAPDRP